MKLRLFNLLTVCLATSGLLTPAQAALSQGVKQQMNSDAVQHLVCVKEAEHFVCHPQTRVAESARATENHNSSNVTVVSPLLTPTQQGAIANILLGFSYLLPCALGLGLFLYNKYQIRRSHVLIEQIEFLERLWQNDSDNNTSRDTQMRG